MKHFLNPVRGQKSVNIINHHCWFHYNNHNLVRGQGLILLGSIKMHRDCALKNLFCNHVILLLKQINMETMSACWRKLWKLLGPVKKVVSMGIVLSKEQSLVSLLSVPWIIKKQTCNGNYGGTYLTGYHPLLYIGQCIFALFAASIR